MRDVTRGPSRTLRQRRSTGAGWTWPVLVAALASCAPSMARELDTGAGPGETGARDGGTSPSGDGGAARDAGTSPSGDGGAARDASSAPDASRDDAGAGPTTPIELARAWVAGWYGGGLRGVNRYAHGSVPGGVDGFYTVWATDPGATAYENVTDCSNFSDVLFQRAYGWWPPTTHARPLAEDFYWAVRDGNHFVSVDRASELRVGDVIALLYGASDGGDTGHVAFVDALPEPFDGAPVVAGLTQLVVSIVDSSHGFHGATASDAAHQDLRRLGPPAGTPTCTTDDECVAQYGASAVCNTWTSTSAVCAYTGIGRGRMRLYVGADGRIAGYTWANNTGSTFYPRPSPLPSSGSPFVGRDIVVGRYLP